MFFEYIFNENKEFKKIENFFDFNLNNDEVIVMPKYVGICGSDLFHYLNVKNSILKLGHEWVGEVHSIGVAVKNISVGDWITTSATLGCGKCIQCQNMQVNLCHSPIHLGSTDFGALSSHLKFKAFNAIKLKSKESSQVLVEVLAVAQQAMKMITGAPRNVLILGAGSVGILCAELLKNNTSVNEVQILDVSAFRISQAIKMKHKAQLLSHFLLEQLNPEFDLIIDATNDRTAPGGWKYINHFGRVGYQAIIIGKYLKSIELDSNSFAKKKAQISFMRGVPLDTLNETIELFSSQLKYLEENIITHVYEPENMQLAIETALDTSKSIKVVIRL